VSNTFGKAFRFTYFGESHGPCIGVVVDGCPAGLKIRAEEIQIELDRRRPAQSELTTTREEVDRVEVLAGIFDGKTTGSAISMVIKNECVDSTPYEKQKDLLRPGHADYTAFEKYGSFNDYRGGGVFSGRITAGFVMAGAIAKKLLKKIDVETLAYTKEIAEIGSRDMKIEHIRKNRKSSLVRCPDLQAANEMIKAIRKARKGGDSVGGIIEGIALNVPVGLGEPIFESLEGELAKLIFAIPAVKGVEFGAGFEAARLKGFENNDQFEIKENRSVTKTNNCGGILGGISNGMPIVLRVAIKPTPSISKPQKTVNISEMKEETISIRGKHDPCLVPRAVPVVESCMAIVLADFALQAGKIPRVIK